MVERSITEVIEEILIQGNGKLTSDRMKLKEEKMSIEDYRSMAVGFGKEKKYDDAFYLLKKAIDKEPKSGLLYATLAVYFYSAGKKEEGNMALGLAHNYEEKKNWVYYHDLGAVYHTKGDHSKAKEFYKKSLQITATADTYNDLGNLYVNLKEWDDAKTVFIKWHELSTDANRYDTLQEKLKNVDEEEAKTVMKSLDEHIKKGQFEEANERLKRWYKLSKDYNKYKEKLGEINIEKWNTNVGCTAGFICLAGWGGGGYGIYRLMGNVTESNYILVPVSVIGGLVLGVGVGLGIYGLFSKTKNK